jgi:hypothetical protein
MGTSRSYKATIKKQPQWGNLSGAVTSNCGVGSIPNSNLANILSRYVGVIGGSSKAGRGTSPIAGKAGIRAAKNIAGFLGGFSGDGSLNKALEDIGLKDLVGKPLNDIINALIEYCSGPANTIDDVAAKTAIQNLLEELVEGAENSEDLEKQLKESLNKESLEDILIKYFSYYMFEHLSIMFYEKLIIEKGKTDCDELFKQIKDYINAKLKSLNKTNPLDRIDWKSDRADQLVKNIQEDVLKVFENYES